MMYKSHLKVSFISRFLSLNTEIDARLPRVPNMATRGIRQPSTKVDSSRLLLEREVELDMASHLFIICTETFLIVFPWLSEKKTVNKCIKYIDIDTTDSSFNQVHVGI